MQLRTADTPQAFNGFGFSLQAKVLPGVKIGGAYNKTYFNPLSQRSVLHGGTDYWAFGGKGKWRNLEWGANWVRQNNGDLAFIPDPAGGPASVAVGFSANGVELYSRLKFGKFAAVVGFDDYMPFDLSPLINPDFKTRYAVLGARMAHLAIRLRVFRIKAGRHHRRPRERRLQRSGARFPLRLHLEDAASAVNFGGGCPAHFQKVRSSVFG